MEARKRSPEEFRSLGCITTCCWRLQNEDTWVCESLPVREVPLLPEVLGVGGRVAYGSIRESGVMIGVGTSLRESHTLVETSRPE